MSNVLQNCKNLELLGRPAPRPPSASCGWGLCSQIPKLFLALIISVIKLSMRAILTFEIKMLLYNNDSKCWSTFAFAPIFIFQLGIFYLIGRIFLASVCRAPSLRHWLSSGQDNNY